MEVPNYQEHILKEVEMLEKTAKCIKIISEEIKKLNEILKNHNNDIKEEILS